MEKLNSYIGLAKNDYFYAKSSMEAGRSLGNFNVIASLCAQAGEKFLKAVIERGFSDDPSVLDLLHSHNLRALYNKIITRYSLSVTSKDCKWLGDFYYDARYPGDNFVEVNESDAQECLNIVQQIQKDVYGILNLIGNKEEEAKEMLSKIKAFS